MLARHDLHACRNRRARKDLRTPMTSETFSKPLRRTFFVADLKCYMCGSVSGSIESEQSLTAAPHVPRPVLLRQPGHATSPSQILNWRHLRCDRCGGPLFLDETGSRHPPLRGVQLARRTAAPRSAAEAADRRAPPRTRAARIPGRLTRAVACKRGQGRPLRRPASASCSSERTKNPMLAGRSASRRTRYGYHSSPYGRYTRTP